MDEALETDRVKEKRLAGDAKRSSGGKEVEEAVQGENSVEGKCIFSTSSIERGGRTWIMCDPHQPLTNGCRDWDKLEPSQVICH